MNLVDANVLLYAVNEADPKHDAARSWLDASLTEGPTVGFARAVILAFLRLSTKVGLFPRPLPVNEALQRVKDWTSQPASVLVEPTSRHLDLLAGLLAEVGTGGNLASDAHLAALAWSAMRPSSPTTATSVASRASAGQSPRLSSPKLRGG